MSISWRRFLDLDLDLDLDPDWDERGYWAGWDAWDGDADFEHARLSNTSVSFQLGRSILRLGWLLRFFWLSME